MCVPPIDVRIEPEALNLKRKGVFTAFITVPRDYNMRDWNLHDMTCEGASAKFGFAHGSVYYATFRTQDLHRCDAGKVGHVHSERQIPERRERSSCPGE